MTFRGWRHGLMATGAVAALFAAATAADAGGFAVREQSAEFQGMSFAGHGAAGGGLSGMFWNPAVAAYAPTGFYSEAHYAAIIGNSEITGDLFTPAGVMVPGLPRNSGDIAKDAVVPSSYMSYRVNERLVFAMSVNSPFGLVTEPPNRIWSGQTFARTSEIKTYNFAPTLAYRVTPTVAIGVGLQIQHMEGRLKEAAGFGAASSTQNTVVQGDDTAFGFTAGINWQPSAATHIGLGYRSSIDQTLEGSVFAPGANASVFGPASAFASTGASIKAGTTLPEIVTLSMRHGINDRFTLLGSVEWTNWSRLEKLDVVCANNTTGGNPVFCPLGNGQLVNRLDLNWHDGWFFSLGGEYQYTDALKLRAGLAYEISPIQNATERPHRVPDADRIWASVGATYKWSEMMSFDLAYTHIFVEDAPMDRVDVLGGVPFRFIGSADSSVDIVSASLKIKLGGTDHAPLK